MDKFTKCSEWINRPEQFVAGDDEITFTTSPQTDMWQNTYYNFCRNNAHMLLAETDRDYFSFTVKTRFQSKRRFDQCGIICYLNSENWIKASIEFENEKFQHLGSVVTVNGFSDWATTAIDAGIKTMWYRLSRREDDFCIECSEDGINFSQMRICHMPSATDEVPFGIYAASPENSSFKAVFTDFEVTECKWKAHDGQQPDKE